jgi:L-ornithine Nalpha-acyltransferase
LTDEAIPVTCFAMNDHLPIHFDPLPFAPIHLGDFSVKVAETPTEVIAAQELRYFVFCHEMGANLSSQAHATKRDSDAFDAVCDHLLVRYHETPDAEPRIVGTYRLLRDTKREGIGRYYSESEYDVSCFIHTDKQVLELGRSCTHPEFRHKVAMQLLWRGIGEYVMHYGIELMFGCASFAGAEVETHAEALSYLHHFHLAPPEIRPRTLESMYVSMNLNPKETLDVRRNFAKLPVLIKGYLRLGGVVGDGAFLDHAFNTTDILIVVQTSQVSEKYVTKYAPDSVMGGQ